MSRCVALVLGASGQVGTAIVKCLADKYSSRIDIRAGTRDPEQAHHLKSLAGVQVVKAATGDEESLAQALVGVDILCIVPPTLPNVAELVQSTVQLGKKAGLKHVVAVTGYYDDRSKHLQFGKWAKEVVDCIKNSGVPHTVILLPLFFETYYQYDIKAIAEKGEIPRPHAANRRYDAVAVSDIGKAAAAITNDPHKYVNKIVYVVGETHSTEEVAQTLTAALGREITAKAVSKEAFHQYLLDLGAPPELADPFTEYFELIGCDPTFVAGGDQGMLRGILGEEPEGLKMWVERNLKNFQQ